MKNKKGFIHLLPLILVAIVIVVFAGGIFYLSQKSSTPIITKQEENKEDTSVIDSLTKVTDAYLYVKTDDWKKYTAKDFSFLYSKDYLVDDDDLNQISISDGRTEWLLINTERDKAKQDLISSDRQYFTEKNRFDQDGWTVITGTYATPSGGFGPRFYAYHDLSGSALTVSTVDGVFDFNTFRKLLSTFEFTE